MPISSAPIQCHLEPFCETGTEGVLWSTYEDGKKGYDALHVLEDGDILRVFQDEARQVLLWEGEIKLEYKRRWTQYPPNPRNGQQEIDGYWVHGFERTLPPTIWARWFFDKKPALLIPKNNHLSPPSP